MRLKPNFHLKIYLNLRRIRHPVFSGFFWQILFVWKLSFFMLVVASDRKVKDQKVCIHVTWLKVGLPPPLPWLQLQPPPPTPPFCVMCFFSNLILLFFVWSHLAPFGHNKHHESIEKIYWIWKKSKSLYRFWIF